MKLWKRIGILVTLLVVALSLLQYFQVSSGGRAAAAYKQNKLHGRMQGPVNIRFRFLDQTGLPAAHFRFTAVVYGVPWYWRIFPATNNTVRYYPLETDKDGVAFFRPRWSGYGVLVCEADNSSYDAPRDDSGRPTWPRILFSSDGKPPLGENWLSSDVEWLSTGSKFPEEVILQVIGHAKPDRLVNLAADRLSVPITTAPQSPEYLAIPIRLYRTDAAFPGYWLNLKLIVHGAKTYALALKERKARRNWRLPLPPLRLELEGQEGVDMSLSNNGINNAPMAPANGYADKVTVLEDETSRTIPVCFARKRSPLAYYRLRLWVILAGDNIQPDISGVFNPSGSRNLYEAQQPAIIPYRSMGMRDK
jgi:hypothetical protein